MELIIDVLILFVVLNCAFKLSLWRWWQRLVFSVLLGGFAWWALRYAVMQSKTQIADLLQDTNALQTMAILVTIDSAVGLYFCFSNSKRLLYYPSLLILPVVFYLLTQTVFVATGVDFETTGLSFAIGVALLLPLLAEGVRWLLPDTTSRIEMHLLLTIFVCILGLIATEHGKMVYAMKEAPVDWRQLALTFALFLLLALVGFLLNRLKWSRSKNPNRQNV